MKNLARLQYSLPFSLILLFVIFVPPVFAVGRPSGVDGNDPKRQLLQFREDMRAVKSALKN